MNLKTTSLLSQFLDKNLFERLIVYICVSHLLTTLIFVVILGEWGFEQSQNQQWFFYSFLALDHLVSYKKIINLKIKINPISLFAFVIMIMIAHGLFIGIINGNQPFVVFNDTVPLVMIALNILRMQSLEEITKPIDMRFLLTAVVVLVGINTLAGFSYKDTSTGNITIFYSVILACLILMRPFPIWIFLVFVGTVLLTIDSFNRTAMLLLAVIALGYLGLNSFLNPAKSLLIGAVMLISIFAFWSFLPEESPTYKRIAAIPHIDFSARSGSVGERQQEQDQVNFTLQRKGTTTEWVGLGFGGLYEAQFTHEYIKDYGHAHYSWVWFNLRYGNIGTIYLGILFFMLLYNGFRSIALKNELGLCVAFMCLSCFIFMFTYVNAIWLLSGLQFMYIYKRDRTT